MNRVACGAVSLVLVSFAVGSWAEGGGPPFPYTEVNRSGSEATVQEVLEHFFGPASQTGAPTGADGAAHTYYVFQDGIRARRVRDFWPGDLPPPIDLLQGRRRDVDQLWTDGIATVAAAARFANIAVIQTFGFDASPGDGFVDHDVLFEVEGNGFEVSGSIESVQFSDLWAWTGAAIDGAWSSFLLDNSDFVDHFITYRIWGLRSNQTVWWLFFEGLSGAGDQDYNDFVVEVRAECLSSQALTEAVD